MVVRFILAFCCAAAFASPLRSQDKVSAEFLEMDGRRHVVLENRYLRLTFDPERGGRCRQFLFKDDGEEIIGDDSVSGMFIDHWSKYSWPSGLMHQAYTPAVVNAGGNRVGLRQTLRVPPQGGGKGERDAAATLQIATSPELIGLTVQKTIWLHADSDMVRVELEVVNTTDESRAAGLYIQQILGMGGSSFGDNWYLPSTRGIEVHVRADGPGGTSVGPDFISDPVDGWLAVKDRQSARGLLFVFDYNYLRQTYTSGGTGEWFMESVPIAPGSSFRTEYFLKPVRGLRDFVFGSERVVADIQADEVSEGQQIRVTHDISAVTEVLSDVVVDLRVAGWKSRQTILARSFQLDELQFDKQQQQFTFAAEQLNEGVVISATVRSGQHEDRYEYFYAGDKAESEKRKTSFVTKGRAVAGSRGEAYFRQQPRKRKTFDKPDFGEIARADPSRFRCLVVFGLFTHILRIDDAVKAAQHGGLPPIEFDWANCPPNAVERFPGTYDELFRYNLIVLSDVNYKALGDVVMEMLCDYVQEGGSLLVVGGPYAYGNGEFAGSRFLDVLPVHLSGPFDLKWAGKGKSWRLTPIQAEHELLRDVSFAQEPRVFWHHFLKPKKDSVVVLKAGERPALVLGRYGRGRVAALSLSPTGVGAEGEVQWWDWEGWFPLVQNLFAWANAQEQK